MRLGDAEQGIFCSALGETKSNGERTAGSFSSSNQADCVLGASRTLSQGPEFPAMFPNTIWNWLLITPKLILLPDADATK